MAAGVIILAAGQGTRMKSDLPKVLHPIAGAPMLAHTMGSAAPLHPAKLVVVAGHGLDAVRAAVADIDPAVQVVEQSEQLGTAHAADMARDAFEGFDGDAYVLFGDTPFLRPDTFKRMHAARQANDLVILGFTPEDPARYGRLVMNGDTLERIVEYKDASEAERAITFCNSGMMCAKANVLFDLISNVGNENAAGEYYLTDIVEIARSKGMAVTAVACSESETLGINTRGDLARAEAFFQARARTALMEDGVTMTAPETVWLSYDTVIGRDALIEPNVVFGPGVTVETGARIRAFSHLEVAHVSRGAVVGPYARLRPGAELAEHVHIGNFVEVKNAQVAEGAKINHLSYVGDADVGEATNIGAGTITCNYDGVFKHRTVIGDRAFIGSNTMLVAPVTVGDEAMTASGSVVTTDVPDGALAVARGRQDNKPGLARKLMARLRSQKAKKRA